MKLRPAPVRLRDPAIRDLGFHCFRLFRLPRSSRLDAVAFVDYTNSMAAFVRA